MSILVSVIVPAYNSENNIGQCLSSIYNTDYSDFEVIVVDDGSNDNTVYIARQYPCKVILLGSNHGPAIARMTGANASKGRYLAFTDTDCIVEKDWVKKAVDGFFERQKEDRRIAALTGRILAKSGFVDQCNAYTSFGYVMWGKSKDMHTLITGNAIIDRKMFFEIGGFDAHFKREEDRHLALKLLAKGYRVIFSPSFMVVHNPGHKNMAEYFIYNYNIGSTIGLELELNYKEIRKIPHLKWMDNPYIYALLVPLISMAITSRIFFSNIRYDIKILLYLPFIFIAKLFWRYGAVKWLWEKRKNAA